MANLTSLLGLLIICAPVFVFTKCTEQQNRDRLSGLIQNLCDVGEQRPDGCKREAERMNILLPKISSQTSKALMLKTLYRGAADLFQKSSTPSKWDSKQLQQLRDLLDQQNRCYVSSPAPAADTDAEVKKWRTFWTRLDHFMTEEGFSACAWESARALIHKVMNRVCRSTGHQRLKQRMRCNCV